MKTNIGIAAVLILSFQPAFAGDTKAVLPDASQGPELAMSTEAEQVNVDIIKEKYWARGDEAELGVVQNRAYSKALKLEAGVFGGFVTSDPFLNTKSSGLTLGFHFNEYFALHLMGFKSYVAPSSALTTFEETLKATTNNNPATGFLGSEVAASFLYGKLSLIGKAIIYYDMHVLGGMGATLTETGNYFTPSIGIGQQVYLSKMISLRVDYRLMRYNETLVEKVITPKLGEVLGSRVNWTNSITLGVDFLVDLF